MKLSIINFLRGYSIFTIVLMHLLMKSTTGIFYKAISFGGAGVHVFILCSGFGLYLSHLRKPLGYIDFLKRRYNKVYIPYAIAVLLWSCWLLIKTDAFPIREVLSHLLLYKMFSVELDTSLCYPFWFISTIIQFYLFWPLIVRLFKSRYGLGKMLVVSLLWSTLIGVLGFNDDRPWGSFFLQYLWEFGLGMFIAERVYKTTAHEGKVAGIVDISRYKWWILLVCGIGGMTLSAVMAWSGGFLKLYNDIPSLVGYLSIALIIYKIGVILVNRFFEWVNGFSYELFLVHSLVFNIMTYFFTNHMLTVIRLTVSLILAFMMGYGYKWLLDKTKLLR